MCKVIEKDNYIYVYTEYYKPFVVAARKLNGKWVGNLWKFLPDLKDEIEDVLYDLFGYKEEKVDILLTYKNITSSFFKHKNVAILGRTLFSRISRDYAVKLHKSVSILKGGFKSFGGSYKYPEVDSPEGNSVFLIRNVSINLLDEIDTNIFEYEIKKNTKKSKYSDYTIKQLVNMKNEIEKELSLRE